MVYVDNMMAKFGRMKMCHLIADSDGELHAMADRIGVARKWWQSVEGGSSTSHYDICLSKKKLALQAGATEVSWRQASVMCLRRRVEGKLGEPSEALAWRTEWVEKKSKPPAGGG